MEEMGSKIEYVLNLISDRIAPEEINDTRAFLESNWQLFEAEFGYKKLEQLTSRDGVMFLKLARAEEILTVAFPEYGELDEKDKIPYRQSKRMLSSNLKKVNEYRSQVKDAMQKGIIAELPDSEIAKAAILDSGGVRYPQNEEKPQNRNLLTMVQVKRYMEVLGMVPYSDNEDIRREMDEKFIIKHIDDLNDRVAKKREDQDLTHASEYDIIKGALSELKVREYKSCLPYTRPGNDFFNDEFFLENLDQIENNIAYFHFGEITSNTIKDVYSLERLDRALHPDKSGYTESQLARAAEDRKILLGRFRSLTRGIIDLMDNGGLPNGMTLEEYVQNDMAHAKSDMYMAELYPNGYSEKASEMFEQLHQGTTIGVNINRFETLLDEIKLANPELSTHELCKMAVERLEIELGINHEPRSSLNPQAVEDLTISEGITNAEIDAQIPTLNENKRALEDRSTDQQEQDDMMQDY